MITDEYLTKVFNELKSKCLEIWNNDIDLNKYYSYKSDKRFTEEFDNIEEGFRLIWKIPPPYDKKLYESLSDECREYYGVEFYGHNMGLY